MLTEILNGFITQWQKQTLFLKSAAIGLCTALTIGILHLFGFFELGDSYLYQLTLSIRQHILPERDSNSIVIAEISQNTISKLGKWPITRTQLAKAIENISRDGAKTVAIDLNLAVPHPNEDDIFAYVLSHASPTVLSSIAVHPEMRNNDETSENAPIQIFTPARWAESNRLRYGTSNITTSTFGVKKLPLFLMQNGKCIPSFSLQTVLFAKKTYTCSPKISSSWGGWHTVNFQGLGALPLDSSGKYWINYAKARESFTWIQFEELLNDKSHKRILKDKIVLIGVTAPMSQDLQLTPIGGLSGVEIQAHIINALLQSKHVYPMGGILYIVILLIAGIGLGLIMNKRQWHEDLPITLSVIILSGLLIISSFLFMHIFIPSSAIFLTVFITYIAVSLQKNAETHNLLDVRTKDAKHLEALWKWPEKKTHLEALSNQTTNILEEWLSVQMGGVLVFNLEGKFLYMLSSFGLSDTWQRARLPNQEGFSEYVFSNKKPLIIPSTRHDNRASGFERAQQLASFAAVPLSVGEKIYGVLWVGSHTPCGLEESILPKLELAARPLSLALEHYISYTKEHRLYQGALQALRRSRNFYTNTNLTEQKSYNTPQGERIAQYVSLMAKRLGLPDSDIDSIHFAALSLDATGIGDFEALARKQDGLTPTDWHHIMPVFKAGLKMLEPIGEIHDLITIVGHLFERFDGKGYPDKLSGKNIPLGSRILSIANSFERISLERGAGGGTEQALRILNVQAGKIFDPELVRLFIGIINNEFHEYELKHQQPLAVSSM